MTTQTLYYAALVVHIAGVTMMAGTTLLDYVIFKQFWKFINDKPKALAINAATSKLPLLFGVGFLFLIISGVTMMAITHGAFGEQLWFRIKFGLIILIITNGLAVGRRQGLKLRKFLLEETSDKSDQQMLSRIKQNMGLFHISQLILFIVIFTLSVFKFN